MATVTGFTAQRMQEIEDNTVVSGTVVDGDLILTKQDGSTINAGAVQGPTGATGPTGDVAEAPENGQLFVRKDGVWHALATTACPQNGITHGLKDSVWTPLEVAVPPPSNSLRYAMRNNVWVLAAPPWELDINNTMSPLPSGFTAGAITGSGYSLKFSGSAYIVNYSFRYNIAPSTDVGALVRFTLPASLRPNVEHSATGAIYTNGSSDNSVAVTTGKVKTNGQVVVNTEQAAAFYQSITANSNYYEGGWGNVMERIVTISGTYTRSTDELPPSATLT